MGKKRFWFVELVLVFFLLLTDSCQNPLNNETDSTAPTSGTAISFSGTSATGTTVNWGVATDDVTAEASLSYKLVQASSSAAIDTVSEADAATVAMAWATNTLTATVSGLTASTTYYFAVLVKDAAGNESLYAPASVTTSAATDTTSPTLSSLSSSAVTGTTVTLSATSNEAGTMYYVVSTYSASPTAAQVVAGKDSTGSSAVTSGSSSVSAATAKSFSVTGLSNFTKYYYYVAAVASADNQSSVSGGSFATIGDNCVVRYTFENAITDSIGSYDLTVSTGSASYSTDEEREGSSSLNLDGNTSLTTSFSSTDTISISAWVYLDSTVTADYPVAITVGGGSGLQFYYLGGGSLCGTMGNGGTSANGTFSTGAWHHIVVTANKTDNVLVLYIDGTAYDDDGGTGDYTSEKDTLCIGDDSTGGYFWKGYIDDVQIYSRVLTATEVINMYSTY